MRNGIIESNNIKMIGDIVDTIKYKDGHTEIREGHNLVVNSMVNLVMALFKGQNGYGGLKYWAIGSGSPSWDTTPKDPVASEVRLTNEIGRIEIPASAISFVDGNFTVSTQPTNILQITLSFGEDDCNGAWREFGIFGGNATATANSGILVNKKHHPLINKTSEMTIQRVMRFTLSLA